MYARSHTISRRRLICASRSPTPLDCPQQSEKVVMSSNNQVMRCYVLEWSTYCKRKINCVLRTCLCMHTTCNLLFHAIQFMTTSNLMCVGSAASPMIKCHAYRKAAHVGAVNNQTTSFWWVTKNPPETQRCERQAAAGAGAASESE